MRAQWRSAMVGLKDRAQCMFGFLKFLNSLKFKDLSVAWVLLWGAGTRE